jgi:hypothetical protein
VYHKKPDDANSRDDDLRASAFTFSASKISLTAICFEEKITAKSNKSKKEEKKGPESKKLIRLRTFGSVRPCG